MKKVSLLVLSVMSLGVSSTALSVNEMLLNGSTITGDFTVTQDADNNNDTNLVNLDDATVSGTVNITQTDAANTIQANNASIEGDLVADQTSGSGSNNEIIAQGVSVLGGVTIDQTSDSNNRIDFSNSTEIGGTSTINQIEN